MSKDIQQEYADRIFGSFLHISEPMSVEEFGYRGVSIGREATTFELNELMSEFKYVYVIGGEIVVSD